MYSRLYMTVVYVHPYTWLTAYKAYITSI